MKLIIPPYAELNGEPAYPHPKQVEFHRLSTPFKMYRGGLGAGKSLAGSRELMASILENYQHAQNVGGWRTGGMLYLVATPTYEMSEFGPFHHLAGGDGWLDTFERLNGFKLQKRIWMSHPRKIELITGDTIKFISIDNPRAASASTAAGVWFDESELCKDPLGAFNMLQARLRDNRAKKHFMICTSSPRGPRGVAKLFADKVADNDPDWGLVVSSSFDNPANPKEYVERMIATMSDSERRENVEAEMLNSETAIFTEFSDTTCIAQNWKMKRKGLQYNLAIDWGGSYHGLLIAYDPERDVDTVIDEFIADGVQAEDFCDKVVAQCKAHWGLTPGDIHEVICDYNPREACRVAYKQKFWRGKVRHRRVRDNEDRWSRINTTRWRLLEAGSGLRRLFFHPGLRRSRSNRGILQCMANYSLGERFVQGERVTTDRPIQDSPYSHGADALALYCWIRYSHKRWHDRRAIGAAA